MCKRKETGVHGALGMSQDDWKFNSEQLLSKTLNSRMNIIETRAVLNIVKTDGKSEYAQSIYTVPATKANSGFLHFACLYLFIFVD